MEQGNYTTVHDGENVVTHVHHIVDEEVDLIKSEEIREFWKDLKASRSATNVWLCFIHITLCFILSRIW